MREHAINEPAFPVDAEAGAKGPIVLIGQHLGLTKRELFAAMAMQGALANGNKDGALTDYATVAVGAADALLAALEDDSE
jgi:hypothetical protein